MDWNNWTILAIAANPGLSPVQKIIERDHGMRGGTVELRVRRTLAPLGLDLDTKAVLVIER